MQANSVFALASVLGRNSQETIVLAPEDDLGLRCLVVSIPTLCVDDVHHQIVAAVAHTYCCDANATFDEAIHNSEREEHAVLYCQTDWGRTYFAPPRLAPAMQQLFKDLPQSR